MQRIESIIFDDCHKFYSLSQLSISIAIKLFRNDDVRDLKVNQVGRDTAALRSATRAKSFSAVIKNVIKSVDVT